MNDMVFALNKITPYGLAFDELALKPIPNELAEAVGDYAGEILQNRIFVNNYKELIKMVIKAENKKRPHLTMRQQVLISEQIWLTATKNLNTLVLNTAVKHIKLQLRNSGVIRVM
jgi:hypothetical protein